MFTVITIDMTQEKSPTLYVIGDSFSIPPKPNDTAITWPQRLARGLKDQLGQDVVLENHSIMGCAQDYIWDFLQMLLEHRITENDYVVIALTHPSRFWYFDSMPELTNSNIIDLDSIVSRDESKAIEYFIKYIQRPRLDLIHINNRMGYLAYQVLKKKLKRPIIMKCFSQDVDQAESWSEINWATGVLMDDVQQWEFEDINADLDAKFWYGLDGRYNHMCLSNHEILADKLVHALITDTAPDLTQGFVKGLIKKDALSDDDFILKELDVATVQANIEHRDKYKPVLPWAKRRKIFTGQVDK